mmetsp:Transcript_1956/g.8613  ORF Transcript_1956/g.8613 Transcript_1956/m.8613 type:complete len:318 (-) Transcript_1956:1106-2059(-)
MLPIGPARPRTLARAPLPQQRLDLRLERGHLRLELLLRALGFRFRRARGFGEGAAAEADRRLRGHPRFRVDTARLAPRARRSEQVPLDASQPELVVHHRGVCLVRIRASPLSLLSIALLRPLAFDPERVLVLLLLLLLLVLLALVANHPTRVRRGRLVQVGLRARDATLRRLCGYPVVVQRLENFIRQRKRHLALIPLGRGPARPAGVHRPGLVPGQRLVHLRRRSIPSRGGRVVRRDRLRRLFRGGKGRILLFFRVPSFKSRSRLFSLSRRLRRGPRERRGLRGLRRLARGALQQIRVPGVRDRAGSLRQVVGSPR